MKRAVDVTFICGEREWHGTSAIWALWAAIAMWGLMIHAPVLLAIGGAWWWFAG